MTSPTPPRVLSAGIVLVHRVELCRFLLLRAYNYWDFPKGECGPGERPIGAALRELQEETGITGVELPWGEVFRETEPYRGGKPARQKVARYYLAVTRRSEVVLQASAELGRPEHHEYRWASFDEAMGLVSPRVRPILRWARDLAACA